MFRVGYAGLNYCKVGMEDFVCWFQMKSMFLMSGSFLLCEVQQFCVYGILPVESLVSVLGLVSGTVPHCCQVLTIFDVQFSSSLCFFRLVLETSHKAFLLHQIVEPLCLINILIFHLFKQILSLYTGHSSIL
jgi:hypothetical protein